MNQGFSQPLSKFTVFETGEVEEAVGMMSAEYGKISLESLTNDGPLFLRVNAVPIGRLLLCSLYWPRGVKAYIPALDNCFDFATCVFGNGISRVGNRPFEHTTDNGVIYSPIEPTICEVAPGSIGLNLKVPGDVAEASLRSLIGNDIHQPLEFEPEMDFEGSMATAWRLVRFVVDELDRTPELLTNPLVLERLSETILTSLLLSQPNNYSETLMRKRPPQEPQYIATVERYLTANCDQPITAERIAEIAGLSVSALYNSFRKYRGYTPIQFLKTIRMRHVRDELLRTTNHGTTVGQIASKWGFKHMGRFSSDYKREFGELPSSTLSRTVQMPTKFNGQVFP